MGYVEVQQPHGSNLKGKYITKANEDNKAPENRSWAGALPPRQGLYDPELEKDACGVGFAA